MCIYIYIYIYTHTCMHTSFSLSLYIYVYIYIYIHTHTLKTNMSWRGLEPGKAAGGTVELFVFMIGLLCYMASLFMLTFITSFIRCVYLCMLVVL